MEFTSFEKNYSDSLYDNSNDQPSVFLISLLI